METKLIVGLVAGLWFAGANAAAGYFGYHWYLRGEKISSLEEQATKAKEIISTKDSQLAQLQEANAKLYQQGVDADKRRKAAEAKLQPVIQQNQDFIKQLEATAMSKGTENECYKARTVTNQFIDFIERMRDATTKGSVTTPGS